MPFDRIFLDELSARNDIVDVVSQYVQLKKSGANYFGLCPFHNEKTGSFSVSPDKQIFHCFGCGAGGGVITFVMKAEGLSFPDAVRYLADRAGMQVPEQGEEERQIFWDDVPLRVRADAYDVHVRECDPSHIVEIDSFAELQEVDPSYRTK